MDAEAHKEKCRVRMKSALEFTQGRSYSWNVLIATISALPRWRFARSLEADECDGCDSRLISARKSYYISCQEIVLGLNHFAEFFINRGILALPVQLISIQTFE